MQIKNYKAALAALIKLAIKTADWKKLIRKLHFSGDWNFLKTSRSKHQSACFDKSLKYEKYNMQIRARATYWQW